MVTVIPFVIGVLETIPKGLVKGLEELEIKGQDKTTQTIAENSLENLRRLAVTQTPLKDHQLMLVWKTCKKYNDNNIFFLCLKTATFYLNSSRSTKFKISVLKTFP